MGRFLAAAFAFVLCVPPASAVELKKGATGFLKIPTSYFTTATSFWTNSERVEATVKGGDAVTVNQDAKWRESGFPALAEVTIKKSSFQKEKSRTEVQLSGPKGMDLRLYLVGQPAEAQALFATVVGDPSDKESYARDTYLKLARKFLGDSPLKDLSDERMVTLARFAHITAAGTTLAATTYKENTYLVVDLGSLGFVLNDLKFNQATRVAYVISERLLTILKAFGALTSDTPQVYGLALKVKVPHRSFADTADAAIEEVEIYSPNTEIAKFANADITSQALMDKSIVIASTNRIDVRLNQ